jgi:hypothetical protein
MDPYYNKERKNSIFSSNSQKIPYENDLKNTKSLLKSHMNSKTINQFSWEIDGKKV